MKVKETNILSRRSAGEKVVFGVVFALFSIYALSLLLALAFILVLSLKERYAYITDIQNGHAFAFPKLEALDFKNYADALKEMYITSSYGDRIYLYEMLFNSIWYTVGSSLGGVLISSFVAYALTKYRFIGRDVIYGVIIFTMTIPIMGSTGSTLKMISDLGIYNSPLMLVTALGGFGFNFMILYGFFKSLPWSFAEAVFIDGGGHFTAFFKIMLPQAKSAMFALFIMAWIGAWNDYTTALLYMPDYPTLASGLYKVKDKAVDAGDIPIYYAGLIISIVPVIILFIFCSDTIMHNLTLGGLKG